MKNKYEFEGYDYSELARALGLTLNEDLLDPSVEITQYLWSISPFDTNYKEVVDKCRQFLTAHSVACVEKDWGNSYVSVWNGLLETKDDFAFMQIFAELVGHMWY